MKDSSWARRVERERPDAPSQEERWKSSSRVMQSMSLFKDRRSVSDPCAPPMKEEERVERGTYPDRRCNRSGSYLIGAKLVLSETNAFFV